MKGEKYILFCIALMLVSCGVKKNITPVVSTQPESTWQTCLIKDARGTVAFGNDKLSATMTMQTVRDSMIVISIMPVMGLEMVRFEATPTEMIGINKIDGTYVETTYEEINHNLVPNISWSILQQLCSAELPTGNEKARMMYSLGDQTIELTIDYPERLLDVPVRVSHMRLDRYKRINL